jgi:hypothetical protein
MKGFIFRGVIALAAAAVLAAGSAGMPTYAQEAGILGDVTQRATVRIAIIGGNAPYSKLNLGGDGRLRHRHRQDDRRALKVKPSSSSPTS